MSGREQITLYGPSAERFREAKAAIAERRGEEPGNAECTRLLLAGFDPDLVWEKEAGF